MAALLGKPRQEPLPPTGALRDRLEAERTWLKKHFPPCRLCKAQFWYLFPSLVSKLRWLVGSVPLQAQPCWEGGRGPELTPCPRFLL